MIPNELTSVVVTLIAVVALLWMSCLIKRTKEVHMELSKIDWCKPIEAVHKRTDGHFKARFMGNVRAPEYVHVVAIDVWHEEHIYAFDGSGDSGPYPWIVRNIAAKIHLEGWVNVYPPGAGLRNFCSKAEADAQASPARIACIKVKIDGVEGEGL